MKRVTASLALLLAVSLLGCCGGREDAIDETDSSAVDSVASPNGNAEAGTTADNNPSTAPADGASDVTPAPTIDPPATDGKTRWLRDMASQDPQVLAAAKAHFAATYDDNGWQIFGDHIDHADAQVRRGAIYGVYTLFDPANGKMLAVVQNGLGDNDAVVRRVALKIMSSPAFPRQKFLDAMEDITALLNSSHEPDAETRAQVARTLAKYKTEAQPALPALHEAVKNDPEYNVRSASLQAIYNIARDAKEALPAPMHVLASDPDPRLRRVAARRLGSYKAASAPAVPTLITSLKDLGVPARAADDPLRGTDQPVCIAAADALAKIGIPAVPELIKALQAEDRQVRLLSIRAIGDIGPAAVDAIPKLHALSQSTDEGQKTAAKAALVRIQQP